MNIKPPRHRFGLSLCLGLAILLKTAPYLWWGRPPSSFQPPSAASGSEQPWRRISISCASWSMYSWLIYSKGCLSQEGNAWITVFQYLTHSILLPYASLFYENGKQTTGCLLMKVQNYLLISRTRKQPESWNWWPNFPIYIILIFLKPSLNGHIFII